MQRSTLSAAEQVAGSTDALSEILLRLPQKPLDWFRCVSKHWLSLISHPHFRHLYSLRHHTLPSLLLSLHSTPSPSPSPSSSSSPSSSPSFIIIPLTATSDSNTPPRARPLDLGFLNRPRVSVVRSCNGLLLCHDGSPATIIVCNPTTKKFVTLTLPNQLPSIQTPAVYLAFDPSRSPHFRVVSIRMMMGSHPGLPGACNCECNVYSSETGSWSESFTAPRDVIASSRGVYCNGAIHWFDEGGSSVCLDVERRRWKSFPMPFRDVTQWGQRSVERFGECNGRLHLILRETGLDLVFDVFELEEDYPFWSLKHRVDLAFARVEFPELSWVLANYVLPFYVVCRENEGSSMLVLLVGGTAISYDPLYCTLRKLCDFKPDMTAVDAVAGYFSGEVFQ